MVFYYCLPRSNSFVQLGMHMHPRRVSSLESVADPLRAEEEGMKLFVRFDKRSV